MKILIADDSNVSRHLLESIVKKWGYEVVSTSNGTEAWEVLCQPHAPRLAVLDWMMPGYTGPEVCRLVREKGGDHYIYILLLTGRTQKEDVIEGMTAGADDYVVKPFDQQELNVRLRAGRRIVELQDELLSAREALRIQATHDALTGLSNRRHIHEILDGAVEAMRKQSEPLGVIMLDLDRFKQINDTYGHAVGDKVLIHSAATIRGQLGPSDWVGRYGGEEFLVVSRRSTDGLLGLAENIRTALAQTPVAGSGEELTVTASLGVSVFCNDHSADDAIRAADEALYRAKHAGRNRVEFRSIDGCDISTAIFSR